jgi:hypothetical protein
MIIGESTTRNDRTAPSGAETDEAKAEDGKRAGFGKTVQKSVGHSSLQVTTDRNRRNRRRIAGETLKRAIEEDIKREKP